MILSTIKKIQDEKMLSNKHPSYVMFIELYQALDGYTKEDLKKELSKLYKGGFINAGVTINDGYIELKE